MNTGRGAYRAKPSKRIYIPKSDGRQRPIGIASLEDKLVQKAVMWVLNCVYEQDFLGFSYGPLPMIAGARSLTAHSARCVECRDHEQEGELGTRR